MKEIFELLKQVLNREFIRAVLSNPRTKDGVVKAKVRPLEKNGDFMFQVEKFTKTQAFHENINCKDAAEILAGHMENFRQMQIETVQAEYTVLVSKKGKISIKRKNRKSAAPPAELSHDRKKRYILEEGTFVPFLNDLGVMTEEGKIVRTKTDKFRQINRFLEFIEDILPQLDKGRELTILDFGCGKSYLTFAMYYYFRELKKLDVNIIGLDLKEDVIAICNGLAEKYGYEKLHFYQGDIASYTGRDEVDMVVTLYACDTATDYALEKAVKWNAKVILSVPCCQHELNRQIANKELYPIMDYGILKERMAALLTDGIRAKLLENAGYETQILEFIDMEHTPKNLLIRAVKRQEGSKKLPEELKVCMEAYHVKPTLADLLTEKEEP
jgi:SAM-dependent methyltransferase